MAFITTLSLYIDIYNIKYKNDNDSDIENETENENEFTIIKNINIIDYNNINLEKNR